MAALTQDGLEEGAGEGQHHPVGMDHLAIITGQGDICEVGVKEKLLEEFVRERVQIWPRDLCDWHVASLMSDVWLKKFWTKYTAAEKVKICQERLQNYGGEEM